jgi:DNA-binding MarR family transcriptional regulator
MSPVTASFFDQHSERLDARIATGLHKIGLALKHQTWLQASEEGLSPTQGQVLAALMMEGPQTGTQLAQRLGLTLPTISDSVRVLVGKRLVRKTPTTRHPRASLLRLTVAGHKLATSARAWPEFLASAAESLSESEQTALLAALVKMIRSLQEKGQIPVSRMCVTCTHFRPHVHQGPMPHHCAFVDAPMAPRHLRLQCQDHEEATAVEQGRIVKRFAAPADRDPVTKERARRPGIGRETLAGLAPREEKHR